MIITIQPLKKGYEIFVTDIYECPDDTQFEITKKADFMANLALFKTGIRPVIKWLSIQHTPMATKKEINMKNNPYEFGFMKGYEAGRESYRIQMQLEDVTNYNQPMAMKSRTASTNPGNKMSTASTDKSWRPAKKKAVVAKKGKKVVKKGKKK